MKTHAIICCKNENFHHFYCLLPFVFVRLFVVCCIVVVVDVVVVFSIKFHLNANEKLPEERKKAQRGEARVAAPPSSPPPSFNYIIRGKL